MTHKNTKNSPLELSKYKQDPEIYYNGRQDDDKLAQAIVSIKAVRLG